MRGFIATFRIGFKYLWRNPVNVSVLIIFPIVLILILGNALSSYIAPETDLTRAPVAVAAGPDGPLGQFLQSDGIARFFDLMFTDRESAEKMAADGEAVAAVIDDGGEPLVLCAEAGGMYTQLTLSIIDSYRRIGAAGGAAPDPAKISAVMGMELSVKDVPLGKRVPGAIDYYAVTMLVMILLYTGMNGMDLFHKGLLSDTGSRNRLAPISRPALIGGLLATSTVTSFLQGMITFVFSGVVYGVYWGERIPLVLLTLFAMVLFSQSLCIFLMILFRNQGAAVAISQALFWIMTFVSKGYMKVSFGELDKVFQYAPNAMAHTVIFGAIFGGNEGKMALCLLLLFGLGAVFFILAFTLGRRRLA